MFVGGYEIMNTNEENPKIGKEFQKLACKRIADYFGISFGMEKPLLIGKPPKSHKFDCVSTDGKIVVECKCYTWTDAGNVPSAKLMGLNEAVFYMSYLPDDVTRVLCIKRATHVKKAETLAEYYCRIDGHLLNDIKILEIDEFGDIRVVKE